MTRLAGPLPGLQGPPTAKQGGLGGVWQAVVERTDPLAVSVPTLTGSSQVVPNVTSPAGAVFTVGDEVWVGALNGDRDRLVVVAGGTIALRPGDRPAADQVRPGTMIYDLLLHRAVWSDGTVWRDALGSLAATAGAALPVTVNLPAAGTVA